MQQREPTTAERIFYEMFECGIPTFAMYSPQVLEEGFVFPGAREVDREAEMRSTRRVHLAIAAMVVYFMEGFDVTFYSYKTMKEVYRLLIKHLDNWVAVSQDMSFVRFPPMQELQAMEDLARCLHNHLVDAGYGDQLETDVFTAKFGVGLISTGLSIRDYVDNPGRFQLVEAPKKYMFRSRMAVIITNKDKPRYG